MKAMRVAVAVAALAAVTAVQKPAPASCAAPTVSFNKARVKPGENLVVTGRAWVSGCQDTGSCGGCGGCDYGPEPKALEDISLFVKSKTRSPANEKPVRVAEVDANENAAFKTTVEIPRVPSGRYVLVATTADGLSEKSVKTLTVRP